MLLVFAAAPFLLTEPFPHKLHHSPTPEKHQIETMPGGVAALDFDNDGWTDVFFTNGAAAGSLRKTGPQFWNRLYRNRGGGKFEDVTERAGLQGEGYSMGAAAGDFDGDGFIDLFVAGVERNLLYRNRGDGTFEDVTRKAGVPHLGWAIGGGWFDYDRDGDLDLFIVNYVVFKPDQEPFCGDAFRRYRTYCHPKFYKELPNILLRNEGGKFRDVSAETGIGSHLGKGMAVAFADYDRDGWIDVLVSNDTTPTFLFRNLGGSRFLEVGMDSGVALNDNGLAISGMGVDFRDVDDDGRPDAYITALANEMFPLFHNLNGQLFQDVTYRARLAAATLPYSGWSTGLYDFDNDGRKDIFVANGDVNDNTELFSSRKSLQPCILLRQASPLRFDPPVVVGEPAQHRGAAFADFDNDGFLDVVVTRLGKTPVLMRGVGVAGNNWLRIAGLPLGSEVNLTAGGIRQWNHVSTAVGYASSSEPVVHFGLGAAQVVERVVIRKPGAQPITLEKVKAGQLLRP
ncbi:MAG: CRTAC1 family protein [Bryobacteraceae bacterium]|nr:CRTAC1 family protein [Bryobacteraceae bacterium]MDW8379692.1 CRTAC1 family protein [Bryobacterales bacterium]